MAKKIVLQLGAPIRYNHQKYEEFKKKFDVVVNDTLDRESFVQALKDKQFGNFYAIYRPFWNDGAQMGQWDSELINLIPSSCKIIAMAGAGFDWMDIPALSRKGITYCNGGSAPTEAVGDLAMWHIVGGFRNLGWSFKAAALGSVEDFKQAHNDVVLTSHNPSGHTLGIIGMGKIGYRISEKASRALGMKIVYYDLYQRAPAEEAKINATYYKNLEKMLAASDCVVLATPAFEDKFLNKRLFGKFKKGSRFVNIARGKLVNDEALIEALQSGHLSSAGLDVFYDEPQVRQEYRDMKNVTLTCHNGGGAIDTWHNFELLGLENILKYEQTGKAISPVNLKELRQNKL